MTPYLVLLSSILVIGAVIFRKSSSDNRKRVFLFVTMIITVLLQALRATQVGIDVPTYHYGFQQIRQLPFNDCIVFNWEPLYVYLNWIIGQLTDNFNWLLLAVSIIIVGNIWYFIYKNSNNVFLSVLLFFGLDFFFMSMYSLRQYCALAIAINIITILKNENSKKAYMKSILLLAIAIGFHTTAFVCVTYIIVFSLGAIDKKKLIIWMICGALAILFYTQILELFFVVFPKYAYYREIGSSKFSGSSIRDIDLIFDVIKIACIVIAFKQNPHTHKNQIYYRLLALSSIAIFLSFLVQKITLLWRITYYFDILLIVVIPITVGYMKNYRKSINGIIITCIYIYYIYVMFLNGGQCVPYRVFW